jgi:hypothetical protein
MPKMLLFPCRICGNEAQNVSLTLKEVMFHTWEEFTNIQCGKCGCLQIAEIPTDLSRYYPKSYYSLRSKRESSFKRSLRSAAIRYHSGNCSIIGWILSLIGFVPSEAHWLEIRKPKLNWRILDVGCGQGVKYATFSGHQS